MTARTSPVRRRLHPLTHGGPAARRTLAGCCALWGALLSGCSGHYVDVMQPVHALARQGDPEGASARLEAQTAGAGWDALLVALDEGALLHRAGRWQDSAAALNRAIALADQRETVSVSEEVLGRAPFRMANHEKQALHALQALNYLQLGNLEEALVEARLTDLRQSKLAGEKETSAASERFVTGNTVDAAQRDFFEQLVFGRTLSAIVYELERQPDNAFIDAWKAYTLARAAPADARVRPLAMVPRLLRDAAALGRPELAQLQREHPTVAPLAPLGDEGELVVVVESGFGPTLRLPAPAERQGGYVLEPTPRSTLPGYVVAQGRPWVPEPLSSLEELATRRGVGGQLVDRERSASVGVNTALFFGFLVLFPVGMPLLIKRGYESGVRMGQSWLMLPAELQMARIRLPAGRHTVQVPTLAGLAAREVEVRAGALTVLVTQGP